MEREGLDAVCASAQKKLDFSKHRARYFVYAAMAGCFCSIGMALAYSVAAGFYFTEALKGAYRFMMGATFTLSFTMIIFAGAELFTGNVLTMTIASLEKRAKLRESLSLLLLCYIANLAGAVFMGFIIAQTGLLAGQTGELMVSSAITKASLSFGHGFFRGVMCNMLVCLGIWCVSKVKSETAKLILLFWAVLGFVAPGYEHSIANAGIFTMAALSGQGAVSLTGAFFNIFSVTLGNFVGGAVLVGLVYWFVGGRKPMNAPPSI